MRCLVAKDKLVKKISIDTGLSQGDISKVLTSLFNNLSMMFKAGEIDEFKMRGVGTITIYTTPKSHRYNIHKKMNTSSGGNKSLRLRVSRLLQNNMNKK